MYRKTLLQILSITSLGVILLLDRFTPLGFAHGDLYLLSLVTAALSGSQRLLIGVTLVSVLLTALGALVSPPGLPAEYWVANRMMSAIVLVLTGLLLSFVLKHFQKLNAERDALVRGNQQLRELTPDPDNPLSTFRHLSQFQLFADAIPQIIWTAEPDGTVDYANLAFARYTGRERDSLVPGNGWHSVISPDDTERVAQRWQQVMQDKKTCELEFRLQRHDGQWRWHLVQGAPVTDENGNIIKWCGSVIDIHDLKTLAERFEHVAQATVDAIWDWDIEADTVWWNHGIFTLFGYTREDVMASPSAWMKYVHPDDRERVLDTIVNTVRSEETSMRINYRLIRADGSTADIEENSFVMRNRDGRPVRMVGGMTDVTERNLLSQQLNHAQRLQTIGELTGGVAHDFNNLLTVIQGNNELLAEALAQHPQLSPLTAMISQASERAAALVQRLLAFARRQPLDPRPADIAGIIHNVQPLIRRALPERISIDVVIADNLPAVMIDPPQLENALLNLCLNSRDAISGQGNVLLEAMPSHLDSEYCENHPDAAPGDYVLVSVSDTGAGMTSDVRLRAFDPFFTTKSMGEGSGLGLSMVYGFIKQSGGHISVYSEPDAGTVIRMYLPVAQEQTVAAADSQQSRNTSTQPLQHKGTVLLAEDDDLVRAYAEKQFRALGYQVLSAASGAEALSLLEQHKPVDLLFTDVMMGGGMNGSELARAAQQIQPQIPVLFTSGYSENAISHQGRLQPGTLLLSKPWRRDDLAQKLDTLMSTLQ